MNREIEHDLKKKIMFASTVILITSGVVVRPLMYLAFLYCAFLVVFVKDVSKVYSLMYFLMPFATIFKISPGATSLLTYVLLLFELKLLVTKRQLPRGFLLFWYFYSAYILIGMGTAYTDAIKQTFIPIFFYFGLQDEIKDSVESHSKAYIDAIILSSVLGVYRDQVPNLTSFVNMKSARMDVNVIVQRFSGLWEDPNYYSTNLILALTLTIFFHIKGMYSFRRTIIYYAALILFGAMTGSKTFLLMLCVIYLFLIVETFKNRRYFLCGACVCVGLVGVILVLNGTITAFNTTIERLVSSSSSLSSLTTFRSDLWINYLTTFFDHPIKALLGNGLGIDYTYTAPHNTFIDYIDLYGIIGSGLFLLTCYFAVRGKRFVRHFANFMPAVALIVLYCTLSMIRYFDYPFHITIACMLIYSVCMEDCIKDEKKDWSLPCI